MMLEIGRSTALEQAATPSEHSERVWLFSGRLETLHLILPLLTILPLIYFDVTFHTFRKSSFDVIYFITGTVFLNVIHNIMTLLTIAYLPEARDWLRAMGKRKYHLFAEWGVLFGLLFVFFFYKRALIQNMFFPAEMLIVFTLLTNFVAHYHHTIKQILGIAAAYNKNSEKRLGLDVSEVEKFRKREKIERILFDCLIAVTGLGLVQRVTKYDEYLYLTFAICVLVFLLILANNRMFPKSKDSLKAVYLLRLIYFPLGVISPVLGLGVPFFHGVEYSLIFQKMVGHSRLPKARVQALTWKVFIPLFAIVGLLSVARQEGGFGIYLHAHFPSEHDLIFTLSAISLALNYLHFHLDREIFRMRDPLIRKHLGPLLVG